MQTLFRSATLKLTGWYLLILMLISITFSIVIYQLNFREIGFRLENLQHSLLDTPDRQTPTNPLYGTGPGTPIFVQSSQASGQMVLSLIYINAAILITGGLGSYFLARRSLRPVEAAHEAQSRFTSDASHELRTPLAAMKTEIEVTLRDSKLSSAEARQQLESNLEEVNKLINLSEMLLHISRLEHGKLERTKVDLPTAVAVALDTFEAAKKRVEVTSPKKLTVNGNETAIIELLTILIDNAIKYSPPKSKIHIRLFQRMTEIGIEIRNKSEPIDELTADKVFDRFYRADSSRTNSSRNGYGLGLSIAKKIVDVHNGSIQLHYNDGQTVVMVLLPILRIPSA